MHEPGISSSCMPPAKTIITALMAVIVPHGLLVLLSAVLIVTLTMIAVVTTQATVIRALMVFCFLRGNDERGSRITFSNYRCSMPPQLVMP